MGTNYLTILDNVGSVVLAIPPALRPVPLGTIPFRAWLGQRSLLLSAPENRHYVKGNVIFSYKFYSGKKNH